MQRVRAACAVALAAVACGGAEEEEEPDEPMQCHDIGYPTYPLRPQVDLLLLVGNASSMAEEQAALSEHVALLVSQLESLEGGLPDLHAAVMSDDRAALLVPETCPALTDGTRFVVDVMLDAESGTREFNYTGDLASQLACMVAVGTAGEAAERPLGSLARALEDQESSFRRETAALAIAIVSDGDDASPDEVASYAERVRATAPRPATALVTVASGGAEGCSRDGFTEAAPAPRLAEFVAAFGDAGVAVSLCGDEPLLAGAASFAEQPSVGACVGGAPDPADCRVADVSSDEEHPIPSCDQAGPPCFTIAEDPLACPDTASHLYIAVDRGDTRPPAGTVPTASCRPECP